MDYVAEPIPDVPPELAEWWTFSFMRPRLEGGLWHAKTGGYLVAG